jgi:RHS repeat-associated protein
MRPASGESRPLLNATGANASARIPIVFPSSPAPKTDNPASTTPPSQDEASFVPQSRASDPLTALDTLYRQASARPTRPQQNNAPNPQTTFSGGTAVGGVSTPNAGGGGAGGGSSGAGPGVTNANQFLSANLNLAGSTPTAALPHAAAMPAVQTAAPAVNAHAAPMMALAVPTHTAAHPHAPPLPPHGHSQGHGSDPLFVLDMNAGETIPANTTLNTFSTWSENLLAQVSGGSVMSYSWDTSQAPDLTNISGQSTANLQGTWASFTGAARTDTITVTEYLQNMQMLSQTMTFLVAGTDSPAYSASRPTSSASWPNVITPDQVTAQQATQSGGPYASLGLADGSVQTSFAMPSYNPNVDPVSLIYNSTTANAQPIFLAQYQLPAGQAVPATITAQLTFNGTPGSQVVYNTSNLNPGDWVQIALQGDATGLSTGRYPWQIAIINGTTTTYNGNVDIVNQASSPFGAGWSLSNVEQLVPVSGSGVMLVQPGGTSLWFADGTQGGTFVTPAGDFSTLVQNLDGTYTRTLTDGTVINFDSSGRQTSMADRDGNTTTYGYTNGLLTTITDMNNQVTTLTYTGGQLTAITDPANRSATLAYTGNQLTSITDPANDVWGYAYDTSNDLTTLTDPNNHATTFAYNAASRVATVTQADLTTEQLTAQQMNGLAAPGSGTVANPAPAVLLATGAQAQYTDPNNQVWTTGLDWLGFGLNTSDIDPLGDAALTYRDANGLPWLSADALGRRTRDFFDSQGNVTEDVAADDTTQQYNYNQFSEVTQYTDQENNVSTDTYNTKGDLTQTTDALNNITTYAYNPAGLVTSTTDPLLHTTTYGYDTLNRLTTVTDALNNVKSFGYDTASNVTSQTDARNFTSTYVFDPMGRLTSETLPDTSTTSSTYTFTYDKVGDQTAVTDPLNHTTTSAYNSVNELTSVTDPLLHTTTYGYDNAGNQTSTTDALNHTTTFAYNTADRLASTTDSANETTSYVLDAAGEQTSVTDPAGNQTVYAYTPRGEVASETLLSPLGIAVRRTDYAYCECGCPVGVTRVNLNGVSAGSIGGSISGTMSGSFTGTNGGPINGTFTGTFTGTVNGPGGTPSGTITGTVSGTISGNIQDNGILNGNYSGNGTATISGGLTGNVQVTVSGNFGDDTLGTRNGGSVSGNLSANLSGTMSNSGNVSGSLSGSSSLGTGGTGESFGSTSGSLSATPAGQTTTYQRDPLHRIIGITDPAGNTITFGYDAADNRTSITDALNHTTTFGFDALNRQTSTTDALGHAQTFGYDAVGNQTSVTDALNRTTTTTFDAQGRPLTVTDPRSGVTTYAYDLAGNQTSLTDSANNQTTFSYDASNHLTAMTDPLHHSTTYTYDAANQLTSKTDRDGRTINFGYDNAGRETSETWVGSTYTAAYGYDTNGNLTSASDPNSSYAYSYDAAGDVTSVDNAGTPGVSHVVLNYGYDSFGNRTSLSDNLGGSLSYSYDADNRLSGMGLSVNSTQAAQLTFGYDQASRLTNITRTAGAGSDTIASTFGYDNADRLTNITHTDTTKSTTLASYTYGYGTANQLTSYQDANSSLTYGYDADGQLTSAAGTLNGQSFAQTFSYDTNGNRTMSGYTTGPGNELTSDGVYNYTYDNEGNTLTQTEIATGQVTYFTWDYRNRLTEVQVKDSQGTLLSDEQFTYDVNDNRIGVMLNGVQQLWTVYDGANPYADFNGSGTLTQHYLTNPNALSQFYGQVSASGATQWFLTDNINSIRQVIDTTGSSLDAITYDPYGNVISQTNAANAPRFLYAGGEDDALTGQYRFGERLDKPVDGEWLSEDPIRQGTNWYVYAANSPLNRFDPSGLEWYNGTFPHGRSHSTSTIQGRPTDEEIKRRNQSVIDFINRMGNLSDAEKREIIAAVLQYVNAADFEWRHSNGFLGSCKEWVNKYEDITKHFNVKLKGVRKDYFTVSTQAWDNKAFSWLGAGHIAIKITFTDGSELYLDDGAIGGGDRLFGSGEIPWYYEPYDPFQK